MDAGQREDSHCAQALNSRSCSRNRRRRGAGERRRVWGALVPARGPAAVRVGAHRMFPRRQRDHGLRERLPGIAQLPHVCHSPELAQALPSHVSSNRGSLQRECLLRGSFGNRHLGEILGGDLRTRPPAATSQTSSQNRGRADNSRDNSVHIRVHMLPRTLESPAFKPDLASTPET